MTDKKSKKDETEEGPVGGERLRVARRANDISVRDVAKELHLDEPKVRALERNEFDVLGAPVFAKGHLRKYAELVGVEVDDVMTDYYQMNRASGVPPVVGPRRKMPREINPVPWIGGGIAVVIVMSAAYWWFAARPAEPVATVEPATLAPFSTGSADQGAASASSEPEAGQAEVEVVEDAPDAVAPDPETAPLTIAAGTVDTEYVPTPGMPQVDVDLAFTGDCWTEVSDASGRRLFYDLGSEGRIVTLSGDAPLRVIVGDSENVSISVDGRPWPIPASARSGRLARLTISPQ